MAPYKDGGCNCSGSEAGGDRDLADSHAEDFKEPAWYEIADLGRGCDAAAMVEAWSGFHD